MPDATSRPAPPAALPGAHYSREAERHYPARWDAESIDVDAAAAGPCPYCEDTGICLYLSDTGTYAPVLHTGGHERGEACRECEVSLASYPTHTRSLARGTRVRRADHDHGLVGRVLVSSDGIAKVVWGDADPLTACWHAIFTLRPAGAESEGA